MKEHSEYFAELLSQRLCDWTAGDIAENKTKFLDIYLSLLL